MSQTETAPESTNVAPKTGGRKKTSEPVVEIVEPTATENADAPVAETVAPVGDDTAAPPVSEEPTASIAEAVVAGGSTEFDTPEFLRVEAYDKDGNLYELPNWKDLEFHPLANLFPMLNDEEASDLAGDISNNGLLVDIILSPDPDDDNKLKIFDGRNRHNAALTIDSDERYEQKVKPRYVVDLEADLSKAGSLNLRRRQLTRSMLACTGAKLYNTIETRRAEGKFNFEGNTRDLVASYLGNGVSGKYIDGARALMEKAPDLFQVVEEGGETVSQALRALKDRTETEGREGGEGGNNQSGARNEPTLVTLDLAAIQSKRVAVTSGGAKNISRREAITLAYIAEFLMEKHGFDQAKFEKWLKTKGTV